MNFKKNESSQKLRGGYYTDPQIARFLTEWVLEIKPKRILEPSCGDGVFISALAEAGSGFEAGSSFVEKVTALEIEEGEAELARNKAKDVRHFRVEIVVRDFLSWIIARIGQVPEFDAVLGNPPFIRYQYLPEIQQARAAKIFEYFRLRFTKHTNAWVPFVVASVSQLRPSGRLAMVVPAELLHVLHAESLREFLVGECSKVLVVDPSELWFGETLQGVVLLLAERKPEKRAPDGEVAVVSVRDRSFLAQSPGTLFDGANFVRGKALKRKWMRALLSQDERAILDELAGEANVHQFRDIASVDVGIVTGANKFFLVTDAVVQKYRLQRWAHPMFGRSEHVPGLIYDASVHRRNQKLGLPTNFLWFDETPRNQLGDGVQEYIAEGEKEGLPSRYKCRIRKPWYSVPSVYAAPVGMLKRSHDFPRLVLNKAQAFTTDTAYRVQPCSHIKADLLVLGFINSVTALSAELEGRHYGGGVLELVPSEIEELLVPVPRAAEMSLRQLDRRFIARTSSESILAEQDAVVLKGIGLSSNGIADIQSAWHRLRVRRQRLEHHDIAPVLAAE